MFNLKTFINLKQQLINDINNYRCAIDFYLIHHDHLTANRYERKIKRAIDHFNITYDYHFKEGDRLFL